MDFKLEPETNELCRRIRSFVDDELLPLEARPGTYDPHENIREDFLEAYRGRARKTGLWSLQMPMARGGGGLSVRSMAACYEEMNRSIFGPVVFNSAAPADGNMIVLEKVATEAQKQRWLQPIIDGKLRSSFVMAEPSRAADRTLP